jgi:hypothetical protein
MKTDSTFSSYSFLRVDKSTEPLLPANLLFPFTMFKNRWSLSDRLRTVRNRTQGNNSSFFDDAGT